MQARRGKLLTTDYSHVSNLYKNFPGLTVIIPAPMTSGLAQQRRPNVIIILADDLGYGDLSCYGQKKFRTPNIDALAKDGMKFLNHYSGSPVCARSRSSLMTGLHSVTHISAVTKKYNPKASGHFPATLLPS